MQLRLCTGELVTCSLSLAKSHFSLNPYSSLWLNFFRKPFPVPGRGTRNPMVSIGEARRGSSNNMSNTEGQQCCYKSEAWNVSESLFGMSVETPSSCFPGLATEKVVNGTVCVWSRRRRACLSVAYRSFSRADQTLTQDKETLRVEGVSGTREGQGQQILRNLTKHIISAFPLIPSVPALCQVKY